MDTNAPAKRYKQTVSEEMRRQECEHIKKSYPDKIPLVIERHPKSKLEQIDRTKYLPYFLHTAEATRQ